MVKYGYIRVSTKEQNTDRQMVALKEYDIPEENIFCDYQSGKDFMRPAYTELLHRLRAGDLVVVKSIDRLGRNYEEILAQWRYITEKIKADILVSDISLLDTRIRSGNLTGKLIADMVLQILAYVAQTEREAIRQRQAEGIANARKKGKQMGRRRKVLPAEFEMICREYNLGKYSIRQAAEILGMSKSTFYRHYKEFNKNMSHIVDFSGQV